MEMETAQGKTSGQTVTWPGAHGGRCATACGSQGLATLARPGCSPSWSVSRTEAYKKCNGSGSERSLRGLTMDEEGLLNGCSFGDG